MTWRAAKDLRVHSCAAALQGVNPVKIKWDPSCVGLAAVSPPCLPFAATGRPGSRATDEDSEARWINGPDPFDQNTDEVGRAHAVGAPRHRRHVQLARPVQGWHPGHQLN